MRVFFVCSTSDAISSTFGCYSSEARIIIGETVNLSIKIEVWFNSFVGVYFCFLGLLSWAYMINNNRHENEIEVRVLTISAPVLSKVN
jgi:hypothetical protein